MAAVDYFLVLEGIEGESQDSVMKSKKAIDLESWSWSESQSGTSVHGTGAGAGKVSVQDLHFTKKMDKASPNLMGYCSQGKPIKTATLTARKAGGTQEEFLKITMTDALISSYSTGGAAHSDIVPSDQGSLNFAKIEMEYKPQKDDGSLGAAVKAGWDVKANKKV
jgi:type VI secretion system secreted protein Hcp